MELATCSYSEFRPDMGAPIRTTAGAARWFSHRIAGHARLITPTRELLAADLPKDAYEFSYRQILNGNGIDDIHAELARIAAANNGQRLVLLCFDKLSKPDVFCHRSMFSTWWLQNTGDSIPELGADCHTNPPNLLF